MKGNIKILGHTVPLANGSPNSKIKHLTESVVDGVPWHTIHCSKEASAWIRKQESNLWYEHIDQSWHIHLNRFDIHDNLYLMALLRYGNS